MGKSRFRGDIWFDEKVAERTREALAQLNRKFEREHEEDSDEALIAYICAYADRLGHTPHKQEVIGAGYISDRFGGWGKVIVAAKLPPTSTSPPLPERCEIYKEEFRRQTRLFKAERALKKQKKNLKKEEEKDGERQGKTCNCRTE